jgi:hypothetical protein
MPSPENVTAAQLVKASKLRKITAVLLVVFSTILLVWDIGVAYNDVRDDTISELLRDVSHNWWSLPFILMGVMGHLFWNRPGTERHMKLGLLAGTTAAVVLRDLINLAYPLPTFPFANLCMALLGFVLGALWWPQLIPEDKQEEDSNE